MGPEEVYSLLIEANPVPDPMIHMDEIAASPDGTFLEQRREDMQTIERRDPKASRPRGRWLAAAAGFLIIAALGAILVVANDDGEVVGDRTVPELAVARAEQFLAARDSADFQEAAGTEPMPADELAMWEWTVTLDEAGYFGEYGECRAVDDSGVIRVECDFTWEDPVAAVVGLEVTIQPFNFYPDRGEAGQLEWLPFGPDDPSVVNAAYADYLRQFEADAYESACSPAAYDLGAVVTSRGLALTPECAEALTPLIPAVVDWVGAGQPAP